MTYPQIIPTAQSRDGAIVFTPKNLWKSVLKENYIFVLLFYETALTIATAYF